VELQLPGVTGAVLVSNGAVRSAPVGLSVSAEKGIVTWAPGPGYLGTYRLSFAVRGAECRVRSMECEVRSVFVDVTVVPASTIDEPVRMHLDSAHSALRTPHFALAGWALDPQSASGAGIGAVHVWARKIEVPGSRGPEVQGATSPVFLGVADISLPRPDVAAAHGAQFPDAGFRFNGTLPEGEWEVTAYVWGTRTGRFEDARSVRVVQR